MKKLSNAILSGVFAASVLLAGQSHACTRMVYLGPDDMVITGRSMDFSLDIPANIWLLPRGMERHGAVGSSSVEWTSKYGSIATTSWDIATTDGMNEKGLVANLLWLVESEYPAFEKDGDKPAIAVSLWAQYALDNFASVAEAVTFFEQETFAVVSDYIPGTEKFTTVHLSMSDSSGDSAILEYIEGKLVIHHSRDYQVMTNDPPYEQQLAIKGYWESIPGTIFLPGSNRAQDRFVRASYYINRIPQTSDPQIAVASVMSVVRNVSVPYGISDEGQPHLSNTRWRVAADQKNRVYYYENVLTPNAIWVDFNQMDFSKNAPVKKLALSEGEIYAGEASQFFVESAPFQFMGL